jgi:hypothetical protein
MSLSANQDKEVVFVFIGNKLPKYAIASLNIAQKTSGLKIRLIANKPLKKRIKNESIQFTAIEDFYNPCKFTVAKKNLISDSQFRDGFWAKSLERFFVLEQFWAYSNSKSIFHAELDQLLFGADKLISKLNETGHHGVFIPFHNDLTCVASVVYINEIQALESFLDEALSGDVYSNEMLLLAKWAAKNPKKVFALPTYASVAIDDAKFAPNGVSLLGVDDIGGLVDAAQLGQWIGGIDPRNVPLPLKPETKFVDDPEPRLLNLEQLRQLKFNLLDSCRKLEIESMGVQTNLYNLHLHSKFHAKIDSDNQELERLIESSNLTESRTLPGMRSSQILNFCTKVISTAISNPRKLIIALRRRVNLTLGRRPTRHPFISGDLFRNYADFLWEAKSKKIDVNKLKSGDIIFCESELLKELHEQVISNVDVKIILILGNSDKNHSNNSQYSSYSNSISEVYAQNMQERINDYSILPIGIENAWRSNHGLLSIREARKSATEYRINKICWGFSIGTNPLERKKAADALLMNPSADKIENVSPKEHRNYLMKYKFVASPPGNGLDTHRTWEAMYLKCVPIVLRSFMTEQYELLGLPIWIVDDYSELNRFDEVALAAKYDSIKGKFASEALWAPYWERKLNDSKSACGIFPKNSN